MVTNFEFRIFVFLNTIFNTPTKQQEVWFLLFHDLFCCI